MKEIINRSVVVWNQVGGKAYRYEGKCTEITEVSIIIEDIKTGKVVLPLSSSTIHVQKQNDKD